MKKIIEIFRSWCVLNGLFPAYREWEMGIDRAKITRKDGLFTIRIGTVDDFGEYRIATPVRDATEGDLMDFFWNIPNEKEAAA